MFYVKNQYILAVLDFFIIFDQAKMTNKKK